MDDKSSYEPGRGSESLDDYVLDDMIEEGHWRMTDILLKSEMEGNEAELQNPSDDQRSQNENEAHDLDDKYGQYKNKEHPCGNKEHQGEDEGHPTHNMKHPDTIDVNGVVGNKDRPDAHTGTKEKPQNCSLRHNRNRNSSKHIGKINFAEDFMFH